MTARSSEAGAPRAGAVPNGGAVPDGRSAPAGARASAATHPEQAHSSDPPITLRLADALRLAEMRAPELASALAEQRGVSALQAAASRTLHRPPRVELSLGPRRLAESAALRPEVTLGAFQELSLGGYGKSLSAYAGAASQRAQENLSLVRREARVRAYLAWLDALEARALLKLRREALDQISEIERVARARLEAGRSSPGEAALARALVGSAAALLLSAEGDITQADAMLRHVCGIALHSPVEIDGKLDVPPLPVDEFAVRAEVRQVAPDLRLARAQADAAQKSAELGRAQTKPHIEVGPSVTREGTGDWLFLGHVRLPLPGVDPAAPENAERRLQSDVARANVGVVEQAVLRDVEVLLHEREHALRTRELLERGSIDPAREALREAELQYQAGRTDLVSLVTARRELYDVLERWTRAAVDVQRADARLERFVLPRSESERSP